MQKIFATPKPGLRVRKEDGKVLADAGETVDRSAFWLRRETDGDVSLTPVPAAGVEPETEAPAASNKPRNK